MQPETQVKGKKDLVAKPNNSASLVLTPELEGSWGAEEATAADIIIPKILLMHGQSEWVLAGEKSQGELVRSTDRLTLSKRDGVTKVIPFEMWKTWRIMELKDGQYEYRREEPWNATNDELPWDYEEAGVKMRRDQAYNFYVMLAETVATETNFPMRLQLTRTSRKAGKTLAHHFAQSRMDKRPPALRMFEIGSEFINGEKNKYFVFTAKAGVGTTIEQLTECKKWFDVISLNVGKIKDHEVAETETAAPTEEF